MADEPKRLDDPPSIRSWSSSFSRSAKGIISVVTLAGVVIAGTRSCDSVVTAGELAEHVATEDKRHDAHYFRHATLKDDLEGLRIHQVRTSADVAHLHEEIRETRQDLRDLSRGRMLPPLTPEPVVTP